MRAKRIEYSDDARLDLLGIKNYLTERASAEIASRMIARLRARIAALREAPMSGVPRPEYRPDVRFGTEASYLIYYDYDGATMLVLRVLHAAQNRDEIMGDER